jgi:poly(A) polymerase
VTLLSIKIWAKKIGVYGSMLGYFGGISLAIMVAKICQLYPNWPPSKLIERFFFIYQYFPWNVPLSS